MEKKTPLRQLVDGDLPSMVSWFDPRLLARIWVRTIISKVFGQFADHRQLQAATDQVDKSVLVSRYDYSGVNPATALTPDADGAVWVDYIADTGDGFEPTYTMAYMVASEQLAVKDIGTLPRGQVLIFGGDQAYPQATREEYENRLITPFGWSHTTGRNLRKAFAIPGNHDWYDGLAAFDSLFCTARDPLSDGTGTVIGGWELKQHRSYWAITLPHNWWIWGADIQFSKFLDNAQVNYFEAMAEQFGPDANLVICLSEPAWLLAEQQGTDAEENLFKLATIARHAGARVCAVIAGDWHHYNRYYAGEIGAHFFTAGGGGSFLHPTHVLKNEISVTWPASESEAEPPAVPHAPATKGETAKGIGAKGERWATQKVGMNLRRDARGRQLPPPLPDANTDQTDIGEVLQPDAGSTAPRMGTRDRGSKCYPSKWRSKVLSLRNLAFPFFNKLFALGIGVIYWLLTWAFHVVEKDQQLSGGQIKQLGIKVEEAAVAGAPEIAGYVGFWQTLSEMPRYLAYALFGNVFFSLLLFGLVGVLVWYVHATEKRGFWRWFVKLTVGLTHSAAHVAAMFAIFLLLIMFANRLAPLLEPLIKTGLESKYFISELLYPLSKSHTGSLEINKAEEEEAATGIQQKTAGPELNAQSPSVQTYSLEEFLKDAEVETTAVDSERVRTLVGLLYPLEMAILGGLVGGFIWGLYWVLTGLLGRMHSEQAFAALRIKNYKNFLRMRFDADSLTIYPIGLDKVPGVEGWMNLPDDDTDHANKPRLVPSPPLRPRLIEEPIVISSGRRVS